MYSLGTRAIDQNDETIVQTQYGSFIDLKTPESLFYLDDSYYYAGERYERGILSRVWTSNRSDIAMTNSNVTYFVNEIYMRKVTFDSLIFSLMDLLMFLSGFSCHSSRIELFQFQFTLHFRK
jgi:hypothetical protein